MSYKEIKELEIDKMIKEFNYLALAKECLGIVETSTLKDQEISMLIESALEDLARVNIDIKTHIKDNLLKNTVMIYVKAHYGDTDINKRNEYLKRYKMNLRELMFSVEYQIKEESGDNA